MRALTTIEAWFALGRLRIDLVASGAILAALWIFQPGYYTHRDGERVAQYKRLPAPAALPTPVVQGRHWSRTNMWWRGGGSSDYRTERWGK